ncbi:N-acyl amino acid synthase of PEP-CTERM/exosortase system [Candidatus Nitrotoga sp. BS]|uniref:GNAT family N-acyltransferase n=1 Tax=Candidatus Nitrotoga sp. BS TaxID=2890408 RepID=UPI001EF31483|nr:GNAT family N-acyltransferase [Candidatus Nitrotoga sp. BS]CAH1189434.1 N-acyl amino acid synthase of PEP-CTERM/exosortase system [Candidatus Nitrotoga sp. BS]
MSQNSYEYEVVLADTEESKQIHYQLRYQIYCLEKGFLKVENPEEEMEKDLYDDKSIHFLVKSGNRWIGTFRLVIDQLGGLPFYKVSVPDSPQFTQYKLKVAEFSRLGILRPFQKLNDAQSLHESACKESVIMLKVLHAARDYCRANSMDFIIFLCRRSITRVLKQLELQAQTIGPAIFHYGPRIPFAISLTDNLNGFDSLVHKHLSTLRSYSLYSEMYCNNVPEPLAA